MLTQVIDFKVSLSSGMLIIGKDKHMWRLKNFNLQKWALVNYKITKVNGRFSFVHGNQQLGARGFLIKFNFQSVWQK